MTDERPHGYCVMLVSVTLTVDVDYQLWAELHAFGPGTTQTDIRSGVRGYVRDVVALSLAADEQAIRNVSLR